MKKEFKKNNIINYNHKNKIIFVLILLLIIFFLLLTIISYFTFLKNSDFFIIKIIKSLVENVTLNIKNLTILGSFYSSLIGGLFFVTIPLEAIFIKFLSAGLNYFMLIIIFIFGLLISYSINYFLGMKLSNITKKIITPKKFYKIKGVINRYGSLGIFVINVFPLPSQILSAILGVFNYNKTRFYLVSFLGQTIKYITIIIIYIYIIK